MKTTLKSSKARSEDVPRLDILVENSVAAYDVHDADGLLADPLPCRRRRVLSQVAEDAASDVFDDDAWNIEELLEVGRQLPGG